MSRRQMHFYVMYVLIVMVLTTTGCGLFGTREPENPVGDQNTYDLALTPTEALTQISTAISLHDPTLYMAAISVEFSYTATPSAFPENPELFEEWGYNDENDFVRTLLAPSLLPPDSSAELTWTPVDEITYADSAVFRESYVLTVRSADEELPAVFEGLADLVLKREVDGGWRVVRWRDETGGDAPTMSQLRAAL